MYAWFVKGQQPTQVMRKLFANPRCNLYEFWKMGHAKLYFRWCSSGSPLCAEAGTMVSDTPFDSFLFPKGTPDAGKPQWEWRPFVVAIEGVGKIVGWAWMGVHLALVNKVKIEVPNLKELHARRIREAV